MSRRPIPDGGSQRTHFGRAGRSAGLRRRCAPLRKMARLRPRISENPVRAGREPVLPRHPHSVHPDDLHQPAEMARQPAVRDGALRGPGELRGRADQRPVLVLARAHVLFRRRCGRGRAGGRLRPGHAGEPVHAIEEALHHDLPGADDDRADRRRLQLLDDLHRQRPAQPDPGAGPRALRHRSAHPLAVPSGRRAVGHHHRRHLAVDLADLPDLPVRVLGASQAARQRGARHGRDALADLLARAVSAAQAGHRDRGHHPLDGGAEDVRSGRAADIRRTGHLDADRRLLPVGAGVGVQQVQLRRRRFDPAADHVLGPHLRRHLHADQAAQRRRRRAA